MSEKLKIASSSLLSREVQIKTTMKYNHTPTRKVTVFKVSIIIFDNHVEQLYCHLMFCFPA